jgi:hypothetical protein
MNTGPLNDPSAGEENDPVWALLASAPLLQPDPWFAVRTVARCRREGFSPRKGLASLSRAWRWVLGGGSVTVSLALVMMFTQVQAEKADQQKNVQEAFEIMANIDTDSNSDASSSSWQDTSL